MKNKKILYGIIVFRISSSENSCAGVYSVIVLEVISLETLGVKKDRIPKTINMTITKKRRNNKSFLFCI